MNDFEFIPATASEAGFAVEPLQELRLFLNSLVGGGHLPGAVILLARGDKVVLHEAIGRGNIDDPRPLATDAIFRLYSMTKPLTAVAMLLLYEEGKWSFDDPLSAHLPEFEDFASAGSVASRQPVLRELFTHSSGHGFGDTMEEIMANVVKLDILGATSLADLVRRYAQLPASYDPGTRWEYGFAMDLQALMVERITGQRYDLFLEERVFGPLGMRDTGYALTPNRIHGSSPATPATRRPGACDPATRSKCRK